MSCVNSQGFGSYSRVCKGLDEENAIFLLHSEKYFGFVRGNGGFFGARAFLPRVSAEQEKELFRAEAQGRGGRRGVMNFSVKQLCFSERDGWRVPSTRFRG